MCIVYVGVSIYVCVRSRKRACLIECMRSSSFYSFQVVCDAVRCGAVRSGAVRCGAVRCGAVRCGAVRCGAVRCGAVRCGAVRCGAVRCGAVRCGAVRCGAVRCGAVRCVLFYNVEAVCGSLPCPNYVNGWEITCVVCTK